MISSLIYLLSTSIPITLCYKYENKYEVRKTKKPA